MWEWAKNLYDRTVNVRNYFDIIEKLLDIKVARLCFLGPKEDQQPTAMAQLLLLCWVTWLSMILSRKTKEKPI